jgi:hypothetical protein
MNSLSCGGGSPSTPPTTLAPTPTPTTSAPPIGASCRFGRGVTYPDCARASSQLLPDLERAMDQLIQQKPQLFDLQSKSAPATKAYRVLNKEAYMNGLFANLVAAGLCRR